MKRDFAESTSVALVVLASFFGGCNGEIGVQAAIDQTGDGFDAGPGATGSQGPELPVPELADEQGENAFLQSFVYGSTGTRCVDGEAQEWVVVSRQPVDCAQHAAWIDMPSDEVLVARREEGAETLMQLQSDKLCAGEAGCVAVGAIRDGPSDWELMTDDRSVSLALAITECDYPSVLPSDAQALARAIRVSDVALYQGVRASLQNGSDVPIVAGRPGLVRVFVEPEAAWSNRDIVAELTFDEEVETQNVSVSGASVESDPTSTFNFEIDANRIKPDSQLSVTLREEGACAPPGTEVVQPRFPSESSYALGAESLSSPLRVRLVPVQRGGSTPSIGAGTLEAYQQLLFSLYPVSDVELEVAPALSFEGGVGASGQGWAELLSACMVRRAQDAPENDVFYYCVVEPAESLQEYCGGGCVAGLGVVSEARDQSSRAAVGLGYGPLSASTFVHEMGHSSGRLHAPCGPIASESIDPGFPQRDGSIGGWGYDVLSKRLQPPSSSDIMGYCEDQWISAYNYSAIFERLVSVTAERQTLTSHNAWLMFSIDAEGAAQVANEGQPLQLKGLPPGSIAQATLLDSRGTELGQGEAFIAKFNHVSGAIVHIPTPSSIVSSVRIEGLGELVLPVRDAR